MYLNSLLNSSLFKWYFTAPVRTEDRTLLVTVSVSPVLSAAGAESAPGPPAESGGRFKCRFCTYSSKHKWVLIQHVRTHTGERPFQCEYCLKTFTQRTNLKTHLRFHTGERPYSCEFCPKTFAQCSNFKAHVHRHTRAEPHKCAICFRTFANTSLLMAHTRQCH
ncbi:unnamed protein product [Ixodes pacificus]